MNIIRVNASMYVVQSFLFFDKWISFNRIYTFSLFWSYIFTTSFSDGRSFVNEKTFSSLKNE